MLVENNEELAAAAKARSGPAGLGELTIVVGDAGNPAVFADYLPVDLLLLCGIFGNISTDDIKTTIASVPSLLAPGGFMIWTRGDQEPDLREQIRRWFVEAGLVEVCFDGHPQPFGVGVSRQIESGPASDTTPPPRLFTFDVEPGYRTSTCSTLTRPNVITRTSPDEVRTDHQHPYLTITCH
jgi:hypothetical protein